MENQQFFVEKPSRLLTEDEIEMIVWESAPSSVAAVAHMHNEIEVLYILSGRFVATVDGRKYDLDRGDLILFCANAIHHVIALDDPVHRYYCVKIKTTLLQSLSGRKEAADYTLRFALSRADMPCLWKRAELEGTDILRAVRQLAEEFEQKKYAAEIAMKCKTAELLLYLLRDSYQKSPELSPEDEMTRCIYRSLIYIHKHFTEELEERSLAARFGISYSYFSRYFKRITGMRFRQYLNTLRINYAEQLLLTSGRSVTEIAGECGYNNVSYFIQMYRRCKAETPKQTVRRAFVSG